MERDSENMEKLLDTDRESWWGKQDTKYSGATPRDDWLHILSCHSMSCYKKMERVKKGGEREGGIKTKALGEEG